MSNDRSFLNRDSHGAANRNFAIVVARFNSEITSRLLDGARQALAEAKAATIEVHHVPGSFELPLAAKLLAVTHRFHAIVALGAVVRGDTPHFDYVAGECARGLQNVALETGVPIAFGVLTTDNQQQALDRAGGKVGNKGYDAAMTAVEMACFADALAHVAGS